MRERSSLLPSASAMPSLRLRYALLFLVAVLVLIADQAVKAIITAELGDGSAWNIAGGLLRLDYTRNSGAAFGFYQGGGLVLAAVAVGVSAGIIYYFRRVAASAFVIRLGLGLILGGAVGNLLDRIRLGYVVDFINLGWWPVFNLADSAIVTGVSLLMAQSLFRQEHRRAR